MQKLAQLLEKTKEIKNKIESQTIDLLEFNLQNIFMELNDLISKDDFEVALTIMENGTLLLGDKINEITNFISDLLNKDMVNQYFELLPSDEQLANIIKNSWFQPIIFPKLSIQYLNASWLKLVQNKKLISHSSKRNIPVIEQKEITHFSNNVNSFEKRMKTFLNEIISDLPTNLENLLKKYQNEESYFEYFSYILHLMQNGYLIYNKASSLIEIGGMQFERI